MFCSTCTLPAGSGHADFFVPAAVLIATSIGGEPAATLRVDGSDVQGSWGVGDVIPGIGTIERIGWASIDVLDAAGRPGKLSLLDPAAVGRSVTGAATPDPAAPADPFADRIRKIDDHTYDVDRALVRELVTGSVKPGAARVSPVAENGKLTGLRLSFVRPGSLAAALGLKNGDTLSAINNTRIESANTLLDLYAKLDQLSVVQLDGTRAGKPLSLTLRLQ